MPTLFLDLDGVLHPDDVYLTPQGIVRRGTGHEPFEQAPRLVTAALEPYQSVQVVQVVLSTDGLPGLATGLRSGSYLRRCASESSAPRPSASTLSPGARNRVTSRFPDTPRVIASCNGWLWTTRLMAGRSSSVTVWSSSIVRPG